MPGPDVTTTDFQAFTGITLTTPEQVRIDVLLDRAARCLWYDVNFPVAPTVDDTAFWTDAVCELAWYLWEQEKAGVMEITALPVSQLSLGTLFWTKSSSEGYESLWALNRLLSMYGNMKRFRFVLESDIDYPVV